MFEVVGRQHDSSPNVNQCQLVCVSRVDVPFPLEWQVFVSVSAGSTYSLCLSVIPSPAKGADTRSNVVDVDAEFIRANTPPIFDMRPRRPATAAPFSLLQMIITTKVGQKIVRVYVCLQRVLSARPRTVIFNVSPVSLLGLCGKKAQIRVLLCSTQYLSYRFGPSLRTKPPIISVSHAYTSQIGFSPYRLAFPPLSSSYSDVLLGKKTLSNCFLKIIKKQKRSF